MSWKVFLIENSRDGKPVETFIKRQQPQAQAKIIHEIQLLQSHGPKLGMPHSKILSNGIYELRIRGKEELRIFYCFNKNKIYLLHGFKKQSQKTPKKEIITALIRASTLT